jgi:hypothetical protein
MAVYPFMAVWLSARINKGINNNENGIRSNWTVFLSTVFFILDFMIANLTTYIILQYTCIGKCIKVGKEKNAVK